MNQPMFAVVGGNVQFRPDGVGYHLARRIAAVAGVFSLVVCALMLYDYSRRQAKDPQESTALKALKTVLRQQPNNEALKEEIRAMDVALRETYARQRAFTAVGAWFLLCGVAVFLIAARSAATLRRKLPSPPLLATPQDIETQWTRAARWSLAALAVLLAGAAVILGVTLRSELPESEEELAASAAAAPATIAAEPDEPAPWSGRSFPQPTARANSPPADEEVRKMWPSFRGPGGTGVSAYENIPESWDEAAGKTTNIAWKTPVPLPGNSSPVVWGERVFLTGADEDRREVYCFESKTGKLLWQQEAPSTPASRVKPLRVNAETGLAASTAATDGRHVFTMFANGDVAAFDFQGKLAWTRSLGIPENSYGHAASLAMHGRLLLVQFDQAGKKDQKSKLLALDTASGKTVWEVRRPVPNSWNSPIVIQHQGRPQIIACGDPWVIAYKPEDGSELWRANCLRGDCGVSPAFANGLLYAGNEYCKLFALRVDGSGDVSKTHVAWTAEDGLPDTCSILATADFVFLLTSPGTLTCYDSKAGEMLWTKDFEANFASSPSAVGKRVYLFGETEKEDEKGEPVKRCTAWVLEPGREDAKIVAESHFEEGCVSSPAFQDGRLYIRGKQHLYCIGRP